jgi:hypothetical protein
MYQSEKPMGDTRLFPEQEVNPANVGRAYLVAYKQVHVLHLCLILKGV